MSLYEYKKMLKTEFLLHENTKEKIISVSQKVLKTIVEKISAAKGGLFF